MLKLVDLCKFKSIFLQCHDNPDADAIASAFALQKFFESRGCETSILYGGFAPVAKSNLVLMTEALEIPLTYIGKSEYVLPDPDALLLTVDCQHGAGNVRMVIAKNVAVIDHHIQEIHDVEACHIRSYLGSCATVVWDMLQEADFSLESDDRIGTALYYGLYTDTNSFSEIYHPLDKDMRDQLKFDPVLIKQLKNSNLSGDELRIAGKALTQYTYDEKRRSALFEAEACDPNILGFISDLALQVAGVDTCVVYCPTGGGTKLSLRSCTREVMANEMAAFLAKGVGGGGGHQEKAGGFISQSGLEALKLTAKDFFHLRLADYFDTYDLIYSGACPVSYAEMSEFRKKNIPVGFVKTLDLFPSGTDIMVRTLEGDAFITAAEDLYLMIGILQEVYPIRRAKFEASYQILPGSYVQDPNFVQENQYAPTVSDRIYREAVPLLPFARACISSGQTLIGAKPLDKFTKVFNEWNKEGYQFGKPGDYLAMRSDDHNDIYIVDREIFRHTYEPV